MPLIASLIVTLVTWVEKLESIVKDLESIAHFFRTQLVYVDRLRAYLVETVLNERYVHWLFSIDVWYRPYSKWLPIRSWTIYFIAPTYALFIPFVGLNEVLLKHKMTYVETYSPGVMSAWNTGLNIFELINLADPYSIEVSLEVSLELWNKYLYAKENRKFVSDTINVRGPKVLFKLLPQLLL